MIKPIPLETLTRAIRGDRRAFQEVVEHHQSFAYSVAYRLVGNKADAEDITQEAFIRLWRNMSKYRADVKLSTWLYKIVTNLCLDLLKSPRTRRRKLNHDLDDANHVDSGLSPDVILHGNELRTQIEKATAELSPMQKAVFVLRDLEALTVEETCDVLSISADHVKSNLFHARKKISQKLSAIYEIREPKNL